MEDGSHLKGAKGCEMCLVSRLEDTTVLPLLETSMPTWRLLKAARNVLHPDLMVLKGVINALC